LVVAAIKPLGVAFEAYSLGLGADIALAAARQGPLIG
jgi:hypothetical protein